MMLKTLILSDPNMGVVSVVVRVADSYEDIDKKRIIG